MKTQEDRTEPLSAASATRRIALGGGLKLAFAAPAVVAALQTGVAHAGSKGTKGTGDHDRDTSTRDLDRDTRTGTPSQSGTSTGTPAELEGLQQLLSGKVERVSGATGVVDRLKKGSFALFGTNGQATRLFVRLKDAVSNVQYRLVHVATNGAVTVLGVVTSNNSGDFRGVLTLNPAFVLPLENGRVTGTFFLQRDAGGGNFVNHFTVRRVKA